jgi:hypothetical protein
MKTQIENIRVKKVTFSELLMYVIFVAVTLLASSCSDDNEQAPSFFGSYAVEDLSSVSGYTYKYDMTVADASNGELNLSNFADLFKVPVKAKLEGTNLTIYSQTFHGQNNKTIEVSGSGTVSGNVLNFTYTTTGDLKYTGTCIARKK